MGSSLPAICDLHAMRVARLILRNSTPLLSISTSIIVLFTFLFSVASLGNQTIQQPHQKRDEASNHESQLLTETIKCHELNVGLPCGLHSRE
ncbi:Uncharacterized protein HZ326_5214 [Fusarium oxysporum f. sp. albedinis]|nr:Uncharacterized protein HZ326_5214 [Fusarium oxysporum f. sp. albedinis]